MCIANLPPEDMLEFLRSLTAQERFNKMPNS